MRLFWAILALILIGGSFAAIRASREPRPVPTQEVVAPSPPPSLPPAKPEPPKPAPVEAAKPAPASSPADTLNLDDLLNIPRADRPPADGGAPIASKPQPHPKPDPKPPAPSPAPAAATPHAPGHQPQNLPPAPTGTPKTEGFETGEGKIEKRDDGSIVIDGRFVIKGDGSPENPFDVPWELLTSVQESYSPKDGKKKVPAGVAMLHGKHVKLSGYVAFPLMQQSPRELLAMLNQWDGCCIGVPPTPYDAVEVRLTKAATGEARYANAGSVQGVLSIKPYLVGDWLVGLYVMDGAILKPTAYGGFGP